MAEFVTLSCPSCGAKLQIGNDIETFACNHCGNEHVVKRIGGIVSLAPVVEQLKKVSEGVDKTASELAIKRLTDDIREIKASMPATGEGCLAKMGIVLSGIAVFMCLGGVMTGDGATIAGAVVTAIIFFSVGSWLGKKEEESKKEKLKPYWDAITEKKKEIEYHEKIVKNE